MAKTKSEYFLIKLSFDTNDGDYVYGSKVITAKEKLIIDSNPKKLINFGSCDWGDQYDTVSNVFDDILPISEQEYTTLKKLGLDCFGELENWEVNEILDCDDEDEDDEDSDW
jgi:hypothetical protein